jgi:hypothetical protein
MTAKGEELLKALVDALKEHGHGEHDYCEEEVPEQWKDYPLLWSGWGLDREGCTREGGIFGDMSELESEIRDMFGYYFRTIREIALKEIGSKAFFDLVIEPSYEDHTCYIMSDDDTIIIKGSCKAWNFGADSPEELAEMMEDDYRTIKCNITAALIKKASASTVKGGIVLEHIDWPLLRQQKQHLLEILDNENSNVTAEQHVSIEGVVSLIDAIQDNAVDNGDMDEAAVFGELQDK